MLRTVYQRQVAILLKGVWMVWIPLCLVCVANYLALMMMSLSLCLRRNSEMR
jgi:hypothetical protein